MSKQLAKKVLLIGWDAADWKIINPLLDAGQMPALENIVNNGVIGNLATLEPPLSPILWTSIATGKRADKHGILGFTEPDPATGGIRPVTSTSRKVKAIWNILMQHGLKCNVISWWPSHPAEPIDGAVISNFYQKVKDKIDKPWAMAPGTVHPKNLEKIIAALRIHPQELTSAHIFPFVPELAKVDQEKDKRVAAIIKILAENATVHSAATWLMENQEWDFTAIYFDGIDHFCHGFMKFHPPQMKGVPDDLYNLYKDVVSSAYRFHDMMLERLMKLAGDDTTVILISDHGFHSDYLRPKKLPKEPAAPAYEHSPYGIIAMKGENLRKDERIYGATLLDIAPTILSLYGLPVAENMDGYPLIQAYDKEIKPDIIPSWEEIEGNSGMHPEEAKEDTYASQEALEQLIELGYIEEPDKNKKKALEQTINEAQYNLAMVFMNARNYETALPVLEELYNKGYTLRYALKLAFCYQSLHRMDNCKKIIDTIREKEDKILPTLDFIEGNYYLGIRRPKKALEYFEKAEKASPSMQNLHLQLGNAYLQMSLIDPYRKNLKLSENAFLKALSFDENNARAHHGLGQAFLRQKKYKEAVDACLNAVGLLYHFPFAHYHLGEALYNSGEYKHSANAFEVCLTMAPNIKKAHKWLVKLYEEHLKDPQKAKEHQKFIDTKFLGEIIIVSGLPRSGTSLMMQMLEKGGMALLTDGVRKPDESNPKGYYEYEPVKRLQNDSSWLKNVENKAVKIISHLLPFLPDNYKYKIIFMQRNMDEIILSQKKLLERAGKKTREKTYPFRLAEAFKKNLERVNKWQQEKQNVELIYVSYTDIIDNPVNEVRKVNTFFNNILDAENMVKVVDKKLYRVKK